MKTYTFTLILSGVAEITPELADALYSATEGDIEMNMRDGVVFLEFERTASTLQVAVTGAIREVEGANVGLRVVRVESETAKHIKFIHFFETLPPSRRVESTPLSLFSSSI